jgi:four helix bundle protein
MSTPAEITSTTQGSKITNYRDLFVWRRAMDLVEVCYRVSKHFPQSEIYGLSNQIRRAAISVPANIAEGHGRKTLGDYVQHLSIANGSLKELETHLLIAGRLKYAGENEIALAMEVCAKVRRMLASLIQKLQQKRR